MGIRVQKVVNRVFHNEKAIDYGDGVEIPENYSGLCQIYYPNACIKFRCHYIDGKEDGVWLHFWDNGFLKLEGVMRRGQKIGHWNEYNYQGRRISKGEYNEQGKQGVWYEYHDDGRLSYQREFHNGVQRRSMKFDKEGRYLYHGEYRDGRPYSGVCELLTCDVLSRENGFLLAEFSNGRKIREI